MKRWVLRDFLKTFTDLDVLTDAGNAFQILGAHNEKALSSASEGQRGLEWRLPLERQDDRATSVPDYQIGNVDNSQWAPQINFITNRRRATLIATLNLE